MLSNSFRHFQSHRWQLKNYWRAGVALALSLLLHALVLSELDWHWPVFTQEPSLLQAELVTPPSPQPKSEKHAKPLQPEKPAQTARTVNPDPPPLVTAPSEPAPEAQPQQEAVTEHAPITDESPEDTGSQQPIVAEDAAAEPAMEAPSAPHFVSMDYDLSRGGDSGSIGITRVSYEEKEDGSYRLRSVTEAKGLASLFFTSKLIQTSNGMVTKHGLQPVHFAYEFGSNTEKYQYADFDWQAGRLTMHTSKGDKTVLLPTGTQDLLSFMYQYMFTPPLQQMVLSVTNGKKLSQYGYSFEGEATLSTKLGNLQTVHIVKSSGEGEEKTELWLATEYHYLPVKISKREKDGKQYEQIVTRISVE